MLCLGCTEHEVLTAEAQAQLHFPMLMDHCLLQTHMAKQVTEVYCMHSSDCYRSGPAASSKVSQTLWTDGRQGCHGLTPLEGLEGLTRLVRGTSPPGMELPVMLQPFIQHRGCLFKARLVLLSDWCCYHAANQYETLVFQN